MAKAVFLDRDGTINVEKNYLYRIGDFEFLNGSVEAMRILQDAGYLLIVITNQSGIARGYYSEDDFRILTEWMENYLEEQGIHITKVYYCPHLPAASVEAYRKDCDCRKPKTGLYYQAAADYNLNIDECYAVGDKIRDCTICNESGCRGFLISNNEDPEIIEQVKQGRINRVKYAPDLLKAAMAIANNG